MPATLSNQTQQQNNQLQAIRQLIQTDLIALDKLIIDQLVSPVPLIQTITQHIINSGGKRLRPLVVILSAKAAGYHQSNLHLILAVIIEFVHTATLLHDDVVDSSGARRGQNTANIIWGNQASVLSGDFLFSRAFQLLSKYSSIPTMQVLSDTTNAIAEGEVLQLMNRNDPHLTEAQYMSVIERKTAKLFEAAAQIGAMLGSNEQNIHQQFAKYGLYLGLTFQIIDDLLDYTADPKITGKNIGDDLAEGKMTLPLIYAMQNTNDKNKKIIQETIKQGGLENLDLILETIQTTHAADFCFKKAAELTQKACAALKELPNNAYREALHELALFALNRNF